MSRTAISTLINSLVWKDGVASMTPQFWSVWMAPEYRELLEKEGLYTEKVRGKYVIKKKLATTQ